MDKTFSLDPTYAATDLFAVWQNLIGLYWNQLIADAEPYNAANWTTAKYLVATAPNGKPGEFKTVVPPALPPDSTYKLTIYHTPTPATPDEPNDYPVLEMWFSWDGVAEITNEQLNAIRARVEIALPNAAPNSPAGLPIIDDGALSVPVQLAAAQPDYAPLKPTNPGRTLTIAIDGTVGATLSGAERNAIATAIELELMNEATGGAFMQAIADKLEAEFDIEEVGLTAIRDAILNRVLAGNHDTVGSVGQVLQNLDAPVSSASGPAPEYQVDIHESDQVVIQTEDLTP